MKTWKIYEIALNMGNDGDRKRVNRRARGRQRLGEREKAKERSEIKREREGSKERSEIESGR